MPNNTAVPGYSEEELRAFYSIEPEVPTQPEQPESPQAPVPVNSAVPDYSEEELSNYYKAEDVKDVIREGAVAKGKDEYEVEDDLASFKDFTGQFVEPVIKSFYDLVRIVQQRGKEFEQPQQKALREQMGFAEIPDLPEYVPFTRGGREAIEWINANYAEAEEIAGTAGYKAALAAGADEETAQKVRQYSEYLPTALTIGGGLGLSRLSRFMKGTGAAPVSTVATVEGAALAGTKEERAAARLAEEDVIKLEQEPKLTAQETTGINIRAEDILNNPDGTPIQFKDAEGKPLPKEENERIFKTVSNMIETGQIDLTGLPGVAAKYNLNPVEVAQLYRNTVSSAARTLQQLSRIKQQLRDVYKDNPEALKALDEMDAAKPKSMVRTIWDKVLKFDNTTKVAMTSQLMTTMRNIWTTGGFGVIDGFERAIDATISGTSRAIKDKSWTPYKDEYAALSQYYKGIFGNISSKTQREQLFKVVEEANSVYNTFLFKQNKLLKEGKITPKEYSIQADIAGDIFAPKLFGLLHAHNRFQERMFQRAFFEGELRSRLRKRGISWDDANKNPSLITDADLEGALDNALEKTFARNFKSDSWRNFWGAMKEAGPIVSTAMPFPKFHFANNIKVIGDFGPWSFARVPFAADKSKVFARATVGTGMMAMAIDERLSADPNQRWYEIKAGDGYIDARPFAPFSTYLLIAESIINPEKVSKKDLIEASISLNRVSGTSLAIADWMRETDPEHRDDKTYDKIYSTMAGYIQRVFTPARTFKDFTSLYNPKDEIIRSSPYAGILEKVFTSLPLTGEVAAPKYTPYQEGPLKQTNPVMKQLTGISIEVKPEVEMEARRIKIPEQQIIFGNYRTGNPRKDNLIAKNHGPLFSVTMKAIMEQPFYKNAETDQERRNIYNDIFEKTKQDAIEMMYGSLEQAEGFREGVTERDIAGDILRQNQLSKKTVMELLEKGNYAVARDIVNTNYEYLLRGTEFEELIPKSSRWRRAGELPPPVEKRSLGGMLDQARHIFRKGYAEGDLVTDTSKWSSEDWDRFEMTGKKPAPSVPFDESVDRPLILPFTKEGEWVTPKIITEPANAAVRLGQVATGQREATDEQIIEDVSIAAPASSIAASVVAPIKVGAKETVLTMNPIRKSTKVKEIDDEFLKAVGAKQSEVDVVPLKELDETSLKEVKAHMGDGIYTDTDGNPIVFYRAGRPEKGTDNIFSYRLKNPVEFGPHAGTKKAASDRSKDLFSKKQIGEGDEGYQVQAFILNAKKPLTLLDQSGSWNVSSAIGEAFSSKALSKEAKKKLAALDDNISEYRYLINNPDVDPTDPAVFTNLMNKFKDDPDGMKEFIKIIKEDGVDVIQYANRFEGSARGSANRDVSIIVLDESTVKVLPFKTKSASTPVADELPKVTDKETFFVGPFSFKPKLIAENKPLYRETNISGLDDLLRYDNSFEPKNMFVTDDPSLALGQGINTGVFIEFRPNSVSGQLHNKPGTGIIGGNEYRADAVAPKSIQTVTINMPKKGKLMMAPMTKRMLDRNFDRETIVEEGITKLKFTRKEPQKFADGGEVVAPVVEEDQPIVESISRRLKTDPDTLRSNLGEVKQAIKQHETGNQNIYQIVDGAARGPGAGYYQFEQKQFGGSGAAKTAVNRTLNTYKFLKQPAPQWLQNLAKDPDPDFTQLDERQQDLIFLGNLNQERGSDKLMRALVEAKNEQEKRAAIENLWRKAHKKVKAFDKFRW